MVLMGSGQIPGRIPLALGLATGAILGSGILSAAVLHSVNLFSPLTFSYHPPPSTAVFGVYSLAMLVWGVLCRAGATALLAHASVRATERLRRPAGGDR